MQYTIRAVPPKVDQAFRSRAHKTGKSLNEVVLDALTHAAGVQADPAVLTDLDWFIGTRTIDPSFDQALEWLDEAPRDIV